MPLSSTSRRLALSHEQLTFSKPQEFYDDFILQDGGYVSARRKTLKAKLGLSPKDPRALYSVAMLIPPTPSRSRLRFGRGLWPRGSCCRAPWVLLKSIHVGVRLLLLKPTQVSKFTMVDIEPAKERNGKSEGLRIGENQARAGSCWLWFARAALV